MLYQTDPTVQTLISRVRLEGSHERELSFCEQLEDSLATEEPLEIRVEFGPKAKRERRNVSITMRTPGNDFDLAAGFLFTEGLIRMRAQIQNISHCGPAAQSPQTAAHQTNVVRVDLRPDVEIDIGRLQRNFYTTSSCGVCGKSSIAALRTEQVFQLEKARPQITSSAIAGLPDTLRGQQKLFSSTGGLHACGLFSPTGDLLSSREDVGRHNALDKLIGHALLKDQLPLQSSVLMVSGRASFELVQKAAMAGIAVLVAVGAPSSLAVELAKETGMTLLGFVRNKSYNIYHDLDRILI